MLLLRIILIFVLVFYVLKLIGRSAARKAYRRPGGKEDARNGRNSAGKSDYSELTDQKIEDADYEEL